MSLVAHLIFLSGRTFTQNPMLFLCSLMVSPCGTLHLLSLHTWHFALTSLWLSPSLSSGRLQCQLYSHDYLAPLLKLGVTSLPHHDIPSSYCGIFPSLLLPLLCILATFNIFLNCVCKSPRGTHVLKDLGWLLFSCHCVAYTRLHQVWGAGHPRYWYTLMPVIQAVLCLHIAMWTFLKTWHQSWTPVYLTWRLYFCPC